MSGLVEMRSTRHAKYQIAYHFVWIPKYRKPILKDEVRDFEIDMIKEIANQYKFKILALEVMDDHIHLFLSAAAKHSPAEIVKMYKGRLGKKLFEQFPWLRQELRGGRLWANSYYVGTAGQVSAETIRRYIEECQGK